MIIASGSSLLQPAFAMCIEHTFSSRTNTQDKHAGAPDLRSSVSLFLLWLAGPSRVVGPLAVDDTGAWPATCTPGQGLQSHPTCLGVSIGGFSPSSKIYCRCSTHPAEAVFGVALAGVWPVQAAKPPSRRVHCPCHVRMHSRLCTSGSGGSLCARENGTSVLPSSLPLSVT